MNFPLWPLRSVWLIVLFFSACIPAQTTPNLDATPGAGAVITRDTYQNELFSLTYPAGWRVITSPAGAPPSVTFVAPGDCALIVVSSAPVDTPPNALACPSPDIRTRARTIALGDTRIALAGSAPAAEWDAFVAAFDRLAESVEVGE